MKIFNIQVDTINLTLWFVALVFCGVAHSVIVKAETLDEALVKVYQESPILAANREKVKAIDENISEALSGWRPIVELEGDAGVSESESTSVSSGLSSTTTSSLSPRSFSLSVTEPIYRGGKTTAETKAAKNLFKASQADLTVKEQQLLLETVKAYMGVLHAQFVADLNVRNENVLRKHYEAAQDRFNVGEVTQTDVAQSKARLAEARAIRIGAEGSLISTFATYRKVTGNFPKKLLWPLPPKDIPSNERQALNAAINNHPAIASAVYYESAARDNIDVAMSDLLPQVSIRGGYDKKYDISTVIDETETLSLSAVVKIPIYQTGVQHSLVRKKKLVLNQTRLESEEARRITLEEVTLAWEALITARAKIDAFKTQVNASKLALEGVEQEVMVGLRTTLDVLDAEQEVFSSRVNLVGAKRDLIVSSYWVKSSIGDLTVKSLGLPVQNLDMKSRYNNAFEKWFGLGKD